MMMDATIDFLAALCMYQVGADPEELLQACGKVLDCDEPLQVEMRLELEDLVGRTIRGETYADAAHAVRQWLGQRYRVRGATSSPTVQL